MHMLIEVRSSIWIDMCCPHPWAVAKHLRVAVPAAYWLSVDGTDIQTDERKDTVPLHRLFSLKGGASVM